MPTLFDPIELGAIKAPNRIFMAPLTRGRATREHVPTALMGEYYAQRASAGLIITEATGISRQGLGWPYAPGLWSEEQASAWKRIVASVHAAGGRIVAQLWHMGRVVHPSFLNGRRPMSASATRAPGHAHTYEGAKPYECSRELATSEIAAVVNDYRKAAENALLAGFDGVQLHAANGYLIDQFLRDGTNQRTDQYGGSIERRISFLLEVTSAVIAVAGANCTAVRLSPNDDPQGCADSHSDALFLYIVKQLNALELAFLEMRAPRPGSIFIAPLRQLIPAIRKTYRGNLVLNSDYDFGEASEALQSGEADAIAFGRPFLANPDLPDRFAHGFKLNNPQPSTFYSRGPVGYADYPVSHGNA